MLLVAFEKLTNLVPLQKSDTLHSLDKPAVAPQNQTLTEH